MLVYALVWVRRAGRPWLRGLTFGVAMWAIVFGFFEAWVPFNMLGEPFSLVVVELTFQLVAMSAGGIAIGLVYRSDVVAAGDPEVTIVSGAGIDTDPRSDVAQQRAGAPDHPHR